MGIRITATQGCGEAVNVLILANIRQGHAPSCRSAAENSKLCLEAEPAAAFFSLGSPCLSGTAGHGCLYFSATTCLAVSQMPRTSFVAAGSPPISVFKALDSHVQVPL